MRRKMALVLAATMAVGALAGCSGGGSTGAAGKAATTAAPAENAPADTDDYDVTVPITIKCWHALEDQYSGIVDQVVTDFNNSQDLITVEAEYIGSYSK